MPKRFDCEDEPNEFMEMPCRCDCGNWFDLTDGYGHDGKVVCLACHNHKKQVAEQMEIDEQEDENWEDEDEDEFERCDECDGHDACEDFGCAIKAGIIKPPAF